MRAASALKYGCFVGRRVREEEMKGRLAVATMNADGNISGNQKHRGKNKYYSCKKKNLCYEFPLFFQRRNSEIFSKRVIQSGCNHVRPHPHHTNINLMCHSPCRDLSRGHANQHLTQSASEADGGPATSLQVFGHKRKNLSDGNVEKLMAQQSY